MEYIIERLIKARIEARLMVGLRSERELGRELGVSHTKANNSAKVGGSEAALFEIMFKLCVHYKLNPVWFVDQNQPFTLAEIGDDIDGRLEALVKDQARCQDTVKHLQEKLQLVNEVKGLVKDSYDTKLLAIKETITQHKASNGYVNEGKTGVSSLIDKIEGIIK